MTDRERLDAIIRESLDLDAAPLADIAYGETASWDSVAHLMLASAIEEGFGITLEGDDVVAMTDHAAIIRILRDRHGLELDD